MCEGLQSVLKIGRNLDTQNEATPPPQLNVCTSVAELQLLTSNHLYSPRNRGTLLMVCVRVSVAPDSTRRLPEMTHEVFL